MLYHQKMDSPVGKLFLAADEETLVGLWREDFCPLLPELEGEVLVEKTTPLLQQTRDWLERYFDGEPVALPDIPIRFSGSAFRQEVWGIVRDIPYGTLMTYGEIARILAVRHGIPKMAAQAVGGAIRYNPISILIPCHRVVGSGGSLGGYGNAIWVKKWLLTHEGVDLGGFHEMGKKG